MKRLLFIAALITVPHTWALAPAPDTMAERAKPCLACHAAEGRKAKDEYYPRLNGKPAGYLFNQMRHFRDGRRQHRAMSLLMENLSDSYLNEFADYFSKQPTNYAAVSGNNQGRDAPALLARGDPSRKIPACIACHDKALLGVAPAIPGLLGLPADYISAQMGAWKIGTRRATAPDCMAAIAKQLNEADVSAIAGWLSIQALPANALPAASIAGELPLRCGSVAAATSNSNSPTSAVKP